MEETMKRILNLSLAFVATLALAVGACSGEPTDTDETTAEAVVVEAQEVAAVSVAGADIVFLQVEGDPGITIEERASIYAVETPMQQLWDEGLTSLEIYSALAPDQEAPEALIAAHAEEVRALGRESDDVLLVELDLTRAQQKAVTPTQCNVVYRDPYNSNYDPWVSVRRLNHLTGTNELYTGSNPNSTFTYPDQMVLLGICNSHASRWLRHELRHKPQLSSTWRIVRRFARPESIYAYYRAFRTPSAHRIKGTPTSSKIEYHLRTAFARQK
jgi:hypothetical protein